MTHALIIDDNKLNLSALEQLLKREGATVTSAESPADISAILDRVHSVDVVFLDLEFPNYDGMNIIGELKANPRLSYIPIVACSVHIGEINEAKLAGFDGFVSKPLDVGAFSEHLRRILAGESVWVVSQ